MGSPTGPYGFDCDYFSVFALENEKNVHEEMFIAPGCLNTKVKMGIYASYTIVFVILFFLGLIILGATWRSDGGWKITRYIKVLVPVTVFLRSMSMMTVLFNHHSVLRYILYALPIVCAMINASLVIAQWFLIVIHLKMFASGESSAKGIVKSFVSSLWVFNTFFCVGEVGLIAAAGVYRGLGGDYVTHNIIMGAGFCWQGICITAFAFMIYRAGMALSSLLDSAEMVNPMVKLVSTKVKWFTRVAAFLSFNTACGSFTASLWMVFTLRTERGMSGFFYLLMFVFVVAEVMMPFFFWWLVLKGPAFGLRTTSDKDSEPGKTKEAAIKLASPTSATVVSLTESL